MSLRNKDKHQERGGSSSNVSAKGNQLTSSKVLKENTSPSPGKLVSHQRAVKSPPKQMSPKQASAAPSKHMPPKQSPSIGLKHLSSEETSGKAAGQGQSLHETNLSLSGVPEVSKGKESSIPNSPESVSHAVPLTPPEKSPQLPKVSLDSMSKTELKAFIPDLLKLVTGREMVFHGRRSGRPEWWPEDVTWAKSNKDWFAEKYWTDNLKSIVTNCYRYMGREDLLKNMMEPSHTESFLGDKEITDLTSFPPTPEKVNFVLPKDLFLPYTAEFYVCFFCERDFISKERMRKHQRECPLRPPELSISTGTSSKSDLGSQPPPMSPKKSMATHIEKWPTQYELIKALDLVAKRDAARLSSRKLSTEVDCDILSDFEPMSPVQLKTPTSLMSQLSRDESTSARKRLSYSLSVDNNRGIEELETSEESDSECGSVSSKQKEPTVCQLNLLNIPVTSLLGQRIKKHIRVDSPVVVLQDPASFCRTPVKNNFLEKLRKKPVIYPVTYKPRRIANLHKQNHLYKFNKAQKKEFKSKANFGLNTRSYELLKEMKPLRIKLQKLSRKSLLHWMSRRSLQKQLKVKFKGLKSACSLEDDEYMYGKSEFPSGPSLLVQNIDKLLGLKRKSSQTKNSLSLSNFVSEEIEEEVSKQKLTLYRSLLYEMSVLKPTVVIDDFKTEHNANKHAEPKTAGKKSTSAEKVEQHVKPRNKETVFNKAKKVTAAETPKQSDSKVDVKHNYKTLRSILNESKHFGIQAQSSFGLGQNIHNSSVSNSPRDDDFSVISVSSDNESLPSTCCPGCSQKKHLSSTPIEVKNKGCTEPLSVKVGEDMYDSVYPSPLSIESESPCIASPVTRQSSAVKETPDLINLTQGTEYKFKSPLTREPLHGKGPNTSPSSIRTRSNSKSGADSSSLSSTPSLLNEQTQTYISSSSKFKHEGSRKRTLETENVGKSPKKARYISENSYTEKQNSNQSDSVSTSVQPAKLTHSKSLPSSSQSPNTRASHLKKTYTSEGVITRGTRSSSSESGGGIAALKSSTPAIKKPSTPDVARPSTRAHGEQRSSASEGVKPGAGTTGKSNSPETAKSGLHETAKAKSNAPSKTRSDALVVSYLKKSSSVPSPLKTTISKSPLKQNLPVVGSIQTRLGTKSQGHFTRSKSFTAESSSSPVKSKFGH